uniref:DNA helicase Pif1-like 2B domain-containing protein n=1 Tax=Aegilops tauschii subsp. strangulata TaxID=200361 RepID=A0A453A405_AEGTS
RETYDAWTLWCFESRMLLHKGSSFLQESLSAAFQRGYLTSRQIHVQIHLIDIRNMLQSMGKEIESFPLPDIQEEYDTSIGVTREIFEESTIELNVEDTYLSDSLNSDQRAAYDEIMSAIDRDEGGVFFVDGKGSRAQIINSSLRRSYLWDSMRHLKLVRNMRAHSDPWFAEYLLRIGDSKEETNRDGEVRLPDEICVSRTGKDTDLDTLIDNTFPSLDANTSDPDYITSRAILSTRNDCVDRINLKMISRFQGDEMVYHSFDCAVDDPHNYYPPEFLNTLTPNGLPPHVLKLKINCPVILLRNIDPANGLCNGTRANMLEKGSSCQGFPFAPLMMRCFLFSSRGSNFQ